MGVEIDIVKNCWPKSYDLTALGFSVMVLQHTYVSGIMKQLYERDLRFLLVRVDDFSRNSKTSWIDCVCMYGRILESFGFDVES